jgi:hypothetical protein
MTTEEGVISFYCCSYLCLVFYFVVYYHVTQSLGRHFVGNFMESRLSGASPRDFDKGFGQAGVVSQLEI